MTDRAQVDETVQRVVDEFGAVDILVNNAGTLDHLGQLSDQVPELWERDLRVNLTGSFNCAQAVWPHMKERGWGRIVNMASVAGTLGGFGQASYSATKAGLLGLTRTLALEGARHGITCNAIVPGVIGTEAFNFGNPKMNERMVQRTAMRRAGEPQDVANAIAFLCSDLASYITGVGSERERRHRALHLLEELRTARLKKTLQIAGLDLAALPRPAEILAGPASDAAASEDARPAPRALAADRDRRRARCPGRGGPRPRFRRLSQPAGQRRADRRRRRRRQDGSPGPRLSSSAVADALAAVPVTFRVGSHTWQLQPRHLGIQVDWGAAVDAVRRQGEGFGPLRGFRRLDLRFFGADVAPPTQVYDAALRQKLDEIATAGERPAPRGVDRAARAHAPDRPEQDRPRPRPPGGGGDDRARARKPEARAGRAADRGRHDRR